MVRHENTLKVKMQCLFIRLPRVKFNGSGVHNCRTVVYFFFDMRSWPYFGWVASYKFTSNKHVKTGHTANFNEKVINHGLDPHAWR